MVKRVTMHHLRCNQNISNCPPLIFSEVRRGRSRQEVCAVNDSAGSKKTLRSPRLKETLSLHSHSASVRLIRQPPRIPPHAKQIQVMSHIVFQLPVMQTNDRVFQISDFFFSLIKRTFKPPSNSLHITCGVFGIRALHLAQVVEDLI